MEQIYILPAQDTEEYPPRPEGGTALPSRIPDPIFSFQQSCVLWIRIGPIRIGFHSRQMKMLIKKTFFQKIFNFMSDKLEIITHRHRHRFDADLDMDRHQH